MDAFSPVAVARHSPAAATRGLSGVREFLLRPIPAILTLVGATAFGAFVVYAGGGSHLPFVHIMFVPILFGSMAYGSVGGVAAAVLAGIAVGPWMPYDVATGQPQVFFEWFVRLVLFALAGALAGAVFSSYEAQKRALVRKGFTNPLTDLPNRQQLLVDLAEEARAGATEPTALLLVEQFSYEEIRELFGVRYSDALLVAVTVRLGATLPDYLQLYHMREDRFAVLFSGNDSRRTHMVAATLLDSLDKPVDVEGIAVDADIRCGIVRIDEASGEPSAWLRRGSAALRKARNSGQRVAIFDNDEDVSQRRAWELLTDVKVALADGAGLELYYQPKVDLDGGACRAAEALVRWNHPVKGFVSPAEFVPALEKTALIAPFTRWVLDAALSRMATHDLGDDRFVVSINVSIRNIENRTFVSELRESLGFYGVAPERIQIELTEGAIMRDLEGACVALAALRDAGVSVALDDYGTGYSSLSYLHKLPLNALKLDRSFIVTMLQNQKSAIVIKSTIDVAHKLGLTVIAEGVENEDTATRLRELGCDVGQGYLWSPALPLPEFRSWFAARQRARGAAIVG
jgi:EAL domain-containing protein (putative c-di-GMP-specific phosphodiesterase class I)